MTPIIVILALISYMIGDNLLNVPIMSLQSGLIPAFILVVFIGFLTYYSCYLYLQHLGDYSDMDEAIQYHFWDSKIVRGIYNFVTFLFLFYILDTYYTEILSFWNTIIPGNRNIYNPIFNAVGLILITCLLKYFNYSTKFLAFSVFSLLLICFFLIWVLASAPQGNQSPALFGTNIPFMTIQMQTGFSIQLVFITLLAYLPKLQRNNLIRYTIIIYIGGGSIYLFTIFTGSYGLINRQIIHPPPKSLYSYYNPDQWQVKFLLITVAILEYLSFTQILIITKKRFFSLLNLCFQIRNTNQNQFFTISQLIFVIIVIGIYLAIELAEINFLQIFNVYNIIMTFIYMYLVPVMLQFKCLYFARPKAVFNIVFKQQQGHSNINSNKDSLLSMISQPLIKKPNKQPQKKQLMTKLNDNLSIQQLPKAENENQNINRKQSKISAFELGHLQKAQSSQSPISPNKQLKQQIQIQKLNQVCPAKLPVGWWKIFDLLCIFAMLLFGIYAVVQNFIILSK